jgi:hypothetical protein
MSNRSKSRSITQYGVQTPNSSTILIVTADRTEAEHALDWITDGRVEGDLALTG